MAIEQIKVRATVAVGSLRVSTPYVQSFNVRKQRGQVSTFDASLKVSHDEVSGAITGGTVQISAGENSASNLIFTGICRSAKISPCYDDPKYVILNISGADQMSLLQGKKYTRRCRSTKSTWVAITGVINEGLKSGKFAYTKDPTLEMSKPELEKQNNVVGHSGTTVTNRTKTPSPPNKNTKESVTIITELLVPL